MKLELSFNVLVNKLRYVLTTVCLQVYICSRFKNQDIAVRMTTYRVKPRMMK